MLTCSKNRLSGTEVVAVTMAGEVGGDPCGSGRGEGTVSVSSGTRLFSLEGKRRCRKGLKAEPGWVGKGR